MTTAPPLSSLHSVHRVNMPYSEHRKQDYMPGPMQPDIPQASEASTVASALKARKRTKTGCLTCRKRRIKCGEERPTCKNCTKSKRDCEGYIPRVVFKESSGRVPIPVHGAYYTQHGYHIPHPANLFGHNPMLPMEGASYPAIAPRPPMEEMQHPPTPISRCNTGWGAQDAHATMPAPSGYIPFNYGYMPTSAPSGPNFATPQHVNSYDSHEGLLDSSNYHHMNPSNQYHYQNVPISSGADIGNYPPTSNGWSYSPDSLLPQSNLTSPVGTQYDFNPHTLHNGRTPQHHPEQQKAMPDFAVKPDMDIQRAWGNIPMENRYLTPLDHYAKDFVNAQVKDQNQMYRLPGDISLHQEPEDDWFDVDSDEEGALSKPDTSRSDLGLIIARHAHLKNGDIRSMNNLLSEPNVLATYNPSYAASPLKDAQTARVFCHFITSTGPTLHVCERHPSNPAVVFTGHPVPKSQQAMWSYTLPMLALHDQGLMHAMLALASLHIAKLQQTSPTPSLRHYHYALRRVAKALSHPKKRNEPATLAATLLLGYYEVTTAEHNKWNSHLSGARELVMEIPFDRLSKKIEAVRQRKEQEENLRRARSNHSNGYHFSHRTSHDIMTLNDRRLDRDLISNLMGWDVRNGEAGEIIVDEGEVPQPERPLSQKDIDEYEVQLDLFWWYAKQDVFQCIISGNGLLLAYERWARIPPRAAVGRLDAVYGSMDHLFLLMARLADFEGRDLPRKKRAFNEAQKAAKRSTPPSSNNASPPRQAPMYGMIPDPGPVTVPRGFDQASHDRIFTSPVPSDFKPLDIAFAEAQAEWSAILTAFDTFYASLGPSYEPLSPEHMTPLSTPFGPAIYYRSYSIACVLCLFHCGRIILNRVAPSMPPAAMVASAVAAPSTASDAITIGRICAGIQPVSNTAPLNPHHGAALMDVCMGLFHAGIQYRDPAQRGWTITKLRDVARLTGWQTSALIASGCERAWIHFADLGKGPPYERTMNKTAKDDRIAGRSRDPEKLMEVPKDNNDRRFVSVNAGTRVYWAMGILSVDEDMTEDMRELSLGGK